MIGVFSIINHYKKKNDASTSGKSKDVKYINDILRIMYQNAVISKTAAIEVTKAQLMEKTNLRPIELKHYIKKLTIRNLIKDGESSITPTLFGSKFFKAFSNDKFDFDS